MTRVDFYVLPTDTQASGLNFVCRLVEKALRQGNKIMVMADSQAMAQELDDLLWSYKPESFLPHTLKPTDGAEQKVNEQHGKTSDFPVVIAVDAPEPDHHDVMINLQNKPPKQFSRFTRLAEIVTQAPEQLKASRENYKFYTERGYPTFHHKI